MPLTLDTRQRAMLLEMGVRVWLPGTDFAVEDSSALPGSVSAGEASHPGVLRSGQGMAPAQAGLAARRPTLPSQASAAATQSYPETSAAQRPAGAFTEETKLNSGSERYTTASHMGAGNASTINRLGSGSAPLLSWGDGANDLSQIAAMDWDALARTAADCQACGMCAGRSHSVLHAQSGRHARWMVVGDPPTEDEDATGQPFTGEDGLLLSNMLKAVGATRGDVVPGLEATYITAVSKCRPPQGRVPQPAELAQCAAYLQREIALVQPAVILAMGRFANQVLLQAHPQDAALPLDRQRGKVYRYQGVPVLVTYTPQALRRRPADKAKAWADLCLAMDLLQTPA